MQTPLIDRRDGTVRLPDGFAFGPGLTQTEFRAAARSAGARSHDNGTLPWIFYELGDVEVDGRPLNVSLCFFAEPLVYVDLAANLYPRRRGEWSWSDFSMDVEAATKQFHEQLLAHDLGPPTEIGRVPVSDLPETQQTLARPCHWSFAWGSVASAHDFRGGGTMIRVSYGDRLERAQQDYQSRR